MPRKSLFILALIVVASIHAQAQISTVNTGQAKAPAEKGPDDANAQRILKERRANAQSMLIKLAGDARNFADARLRARTQARIADALWNTDREQSRTIFRSAWESAEVADAESRARRQEEMRQQQARGGGRVTVMGVGRDLRYEVLGMIARRDPELTEEFMTRYQQQARPQSNTTDDQSAAAMQKAATAALNAQLDNPGAAKNNQARMQNSGTVRTQPPVNNNGSIGPQPPFSPGAQIDPESLLLERAKHARTPEERDQIYLQLATMLAEKDEGRAHAYVDKIKDMETRNAARGFVDVSTAWQLVSTKNTERALDLARTGELTHLQRAWLLSQTAGALGISDQEQAGKVLSFAISEAQRIEAGDADRPRAFFAIANVRFAFDHAGAWRLMEVAVRAANDAEKFTGEDGQLPLGFSARGFQITRNRPFRDFDVSGIFTKLALEDYDKTVELARGLTQDAPRSVATIAIARTVLAQR